MPKHRVLTEFGMGTSLRRRDYTEAAKRAVQDALWDLGVRQVDMPFTPARVWDMLQQPARLAAE